MKKTLLVFSLMFFSSLTCFAGNAEIAILVLSGAFIEILKGFGLILLSSLIIRAFGWAGAAFVFACWIVGICLCIFCYGGCKA